MNHRGLRVLSLSALCVLAYAGTAATAETRKATVVNLPFVKITVVPEKSEAQRKSEQVRQRNAKFLRSRVGALKNVDNLRRWQQDSRAKAEARRGR